MIKIFIYILVASLFPMGVVGAIRVWQYTGIQLQRLRDKRLREINAEADRWLK